MFVSDQYNLIDPIYENINEGVFSKLIDGRMRLPAELKQMVLDNNKAKKKLKWEPSVSLKDGINKEMNWLINNINHWDEMHY